MSVESHPDLEFVVAADGTEQSFDDFDEALEFAFSVALEEPKVNLDVLVYSEDGAGAFGGGDAVESYRAHPNASVFQRFQIRVADLGTIA